MTQDLVAALEAVRMLLVDPDALVGAVASGRRRDGRPPWRRVELRYVDLKAGPHLQVTAYDQTQAHTSNHRVGQDSDRAVADLLAQPFGNWRVESTDTVHQLRVTKKLGASVHTSARADSVAVSRSHDRDKDRLLPPGDPLLVALGISTAQGTVKPSRQRKYRQVEEFLRQLDVALTEAMESGRLRRPTAADPLRIIDLGCGNAYLTFAAERLLVRRGLPARLVGVDTKRQSLEHNQSLSCQLGIQAEFVMDTIAAVSPDPSPEVVLALHACDTATDDALARAIEWEAPVVLAAPCCHHDLAAQLREQPAPAPYSALTRDGILRERFADTLTDAIRALLLRLAGYRVDVVEFVESAHTPRNTLLRAVRTGRSAPVRDEYDALVAAWGVRPRLGILLGHCGA